MDILLAIVGIVFAVLQIILFFKLWGMTNDIREIKNKYLSLNKEVENRHIENGEVENTNTKNKGDASDVITFVIIGVFILVVAIAYFVSQANN